MLPLNELLKTKMNRKELAAVLQPPDSFALSPEHPRYREIFRTWALGPVVEHRESSVLEKSNFAALRNLLADKRFKGQWEITECSHWAVGWVKHLSYRAVGPDGTASPVARVIKGFFQYLKDEYPIADEDDYSQRQIEAEQEYFDQEFNYLVRSGKLPEDTDGAKVLEHIHDHASECHEDGDGIPYHTNEEILEAAQALGYVVQDY